jgi:hypothetical protein
MPPTRSPEMLAVVDRLRLAIDDHVPGERLTLDELRSDYFHDLPLGAADNYLLRAVREAVADGRLTREASGVWRRPTSAQILTGRYIDPPSAPEAPAPEAAQAHLDITPPAPAPAEAEAPPAVDPTYRLPATVSAYLDHWSAVIRDGGRIAARATGPAGCGKTEAGVQIAAALGLPVVTMDCSLVRDAVEWFGGRTLSGGSVAWEDSSFARRLQAGRVVVVLDEVNRAAPEVANALLPLLDRRGRASIADRPTPLQAGPSILWWATCNVGAEYTGTGRLDRALDDRLSRTFEFSPLPERDEATLLVERTGIDEDSALRLAAVSAASRRANLSRPLSTRALLAAAEDLQAGGPRSLAATVLAAYSPDGGTSSERATVASLLTGQGFAIEADEEVAR